MKAEKAFNFLYAIGAAIVIFGAWQKITHKPLADVFLTAGLLTEVVIFLCTAIQELFKNDQQRIDPIPTIDRANNTDLSDNISQLNKILKQIFNR